MSRTVFCQYQQRETEGLDFAPWPGELGQRILAHIGKPAWAAWLARALNRYSPALRLAALVGSPWAMMKAQLRSPR